MPETHLNILELNHAALLVHDVERSCAFYREVLRLPDLPRPAFTFPGAWFRLGPIQELHLIGGRIDPVSSGHRVNHFALRVERLQPWVEHFRQLQVNYRGPQVRPDGVFQVFLSDPDGHAIELCSDKLS